MTLTKVVGGVIADSTITSTDITDSTITNAKLAVDPANASNLSSGDVPLAQLGNVPDPDFTAQKADIALLAFKTQANGNLARYNLVDQSVDAFEDATGVIQDGVPADGVSGPTQFTYGHAYITEFKKFYSDDYGTGVGVILPPNTQETPGIFELKNPEYNIKGVVT